MPVISRSRGVHVPAESQYDGTLLRIDTVDTAADPQRHDQHQYAAETAPEIRRTRPRGADAATTPKQRRNPALQIAQHIIQIVLRLLRSIPGIALLPVRFIPSHACA